MGYAIPVMLAKTGLLYKAYTDFFLAKESILLKLLAKGALPAKFSSRYLTTRTSQELDISHVKSLNTLGLKLFWQRKRCNSLTERLKLEYAMVRKLSEQMSLADDEFSAVYSFISISRELFSLFPSKVKIVDVMHPPHQFLIPHLRKEFSNFSDWQAYQDLYEGGAEQLLIEREQAELAQADIVCAPSPFVVDSIKAAAPETASKVTCSPYPVPLWIDAYRINTYRTGDALKGRSIEQDWKRKRLRVLFVGSVNLRKGVQYLLPALKKLKTLDIDLHVVGRIDIHPEKVAVYESICEFKGFIGKSELFQEYQWADVFVFPSIAEGSAGVIYEAMSFGLPVITTYAAGSIVRNEIDGFVLSQPSVEALADKLRKLYVDRELLKKMSDSVTERINSFRAENLSHRFSSILKQKALEKSLKQKVTFR